MTADRQAAIDDAMRRSVQQRGPRWACRTLEAVGQARRTLPSTRPLEGRTAIVVGAGPSLDLAGPHLERWQRAGACVIATNTAARACLAYGVTPDLVCLAETDPNVAPHIAGIDAPTVMSTYASQEAIDSATCPAFAFGPEPATMQLALQLGMPALWYSGCVAVMGVSIARYLGAARIVLAGVDAAYTDRMYARHTPFADLRPHVVEAFETSGGLMPDLLITLSDLPAPSKKRVPAPALRVANNAGGESLTESQLLAPCELFVPAGKGCELLTVSPHGVALDGVRYLDASAVDVGTWASRVSIELKPLWALDCKSVLATLERELREWEPHETVYPPASVPLATYWQRAGAAHPLRKLERQRAVMADAKSAMLAAVASGLERCR